MNTHTIMNGALTSDFFSILGKVPTKFQVKIQEGIYMD